MADWPGRVSATLFLSGCSLACPYCSDSALRVPRSEPLDWEGIARHIQESRTWLDGVVVSGGEPTEDPDLPSLLATLCDLGVAVRLDTNGTRPDVLRYVLAEQLVSYVSLDVKAVPRRYEGLSGRRGTAALVAESVETVIRSGIEHEFRTTVFPGCVGLDELPRIARSLRGGRLYALRRTCGGGASPPPSSPLRGYADDALRAAAAACSVYLPTIVRGLRQSEDD